MVTIFGIAGCSRGKDKGGSAWTITYSRTGGFPGYNDRIEMNSSAKGIYFKADEKLSEFDLDSGTMQQLDWIVNREDLLEAVGLYKGTGNIQDDIKFAIVLTKGGRTYNIEWFSQSKHPEVLDELRHSLEMMLDDAAGRVSQ